MPGYRKFDDPSDRAELATLWNVDESRLPMKRGWAYPDIIEGAVRGDIRALWIIATNPLVSFPNQDVLRQALTNLDFLVVQDGYHPTPTTELAHLVLPAAIWGEKEGTYTNSERRVSKVNKAVEPIGEARSDFDIFLAVAKSSAAAKNSIPAGSRQKTPSMNGAACPAISFATTRAWTTRCLPTAPAVAVPEGKTDRSVSRLYATAAINSKTAKQSSSAPPGNHSRTAQHDYRWCSIPAVP